MCYNELKRLCVGDLNSVIKLLTLESSMVYVHACMYDDDD